MWVRLFFIYVKPENTDEARRVYYEKLVPLYKKQKGFIDAFILEPVEEGEDYISFVSWESKEDAEVYYTSDTYAKTMNDIKHFFAGKPTLKTYEVKR